jgi:apolipoprotein N-acyltransferase
MTKFLKRARSLAIKSWPWLAAILSGFLYVDCFPPFDQGWFCWFALIPLIAAVWFSGKNSRRRWLRNLLLGYVAGLVFFTGAFDWLGSLGILYQSFWLRGVSLLLALYLALYFAFWAWFIGSVRPAHFMSSWRNLLTACFAASAWAAQEWIRGWLFTGFGWDGLGVALHTRWPLIQIAEFTGVTGLSFVIVFANVIGVTTACRLFFETREHRMRPHYDLTLTMAGIVGLLAFGVHAVQNPSASKSLRVAAVQANVPQKEKFDPQFTHRIFDKFTRLSDIALRTSPPPQLLVWPESSLPAPVLEDAETYRFVTNFCASTSSDLLLGTIDVKGEQDYNAAVLFSDHGRNVQVYHKIHLVPFGEYIPLRHSFPLFADVAGNLVPGDFDVGKEFTVFHLPVGDVRVAPLICFEDTLGELTRQFVLRGANLLVDVTNDAWFLHSAGSQQHLANAIFRCVETRRPMVRAANTGVTCFVNEFGHVTQILRDDTGSTFTEGVLSGEVDVPIHNGLTFYARYGDLFAKICAVVALIAIVASLAARWIGRSAGDTK